MNHFNTIRDFKNLSDGGTILMPACLIAVLALGSVGPTTLLSAEPTTADPVAAANALSQAFRNAAEKATPSVVVVRSETKAQNVTSKGGQNRGEKPIFAELHLKTSFEMECLRDLLQGGDHHHDRELALV